MPNIPYAIAFVDPIISPHFLATQLHKHAVKLVAIFTSILNELPKEQQRSRIFSQLFDHVIYANENLQITTLATELKVLNVQYIFYGYEGSIAFTDQLSELVCPDYANNSNTAQLRSDKYQMQKALENASIPTIKQILIKNKLLQPQQINTLKNWHYPVIIKPTYGGGSTAVKQCNSFSELEQFLYEVEPNPFNHSETEDFVIQGCLTGREYFVDTVSLSGKHCIASVQRYNKTFHHGSPIYRSVEIVDPQANEWKICCEYVLKVLDAVGLKNGMAHKKGF